LGLEHPIVNQLLLKYSAADARLRCLAGKIDGLTGDGLPTFWKIKAQGKDGLTSHHIIRIGMSTEGERAPWLEPLEDSLLGTRAPLSKTIDEWKKFAADKKSRIQELLHREISYSGIINEEMSYSAIPLAIVGIEK
jgi:hypothetical protein